MALSADLLRGYTDTIILRQLQEADSYGYEIARRISKDSRGAVELKEATLYTAFRRMENGGYIISYWGDEGDPGRAEHAAGGGKAPREAGVRQGRSARNSSGGMNG